MANLFPRNGHEDCNMPWTILLLISIDEKDKECMKKGKMGSWLDPERVVHDLWLELAALLLCWCYAHAKAPLSFGPEGFKSELYYNHCAPPLGVKYASDA
jgi:hypothetical protein